MGKIASHNNLDSDDDLAVSLKEMEDEYLSPFLLDELNVRNKRTPKLSPEKTSNTVPVDEK